MRRALVALALASGCGEPEVTPPSPDAFGWISQLALDPDTFAAITATERDGWIALHAHRYADAAEAFTTPTRRARAEWQLAVLHDDLSRLTGLVHERYFAEWAARAASDASGGFPAGSAAPVIASVAAACTGIGAPTIAPEGTPGADLASAVVAGTPPWDVPLPTDHPWAERLALHRAARTSGDPRPLLAQVGPVIVEPADGFERRFYDPCLHRTAADVWLARAIADLRIEPTAESVDGWRASVAWAGQEPAGRLFSAWLRPADLTVDLAVADRPGLVGSTAPSSGLPLLDGPDDVEAARGMVQQLDASLDGWRSRLIASASDDGRALLADLGLIERYRQELLVARAREALLDDRPRQALVILQLARDPTTPGIGPTNGPALFALLAEAELRTGRTREALDALQDLVAAFPEVRPLVEVTGDLAVLRGLDRQGDSREG